MAAILIIGGCVAFPAVAKEPTHAALVAAAKRSPLKLLDFPENLCDSDKPIENWLNELVGADGRRITWTGGQCRLVNNISPLDASSWPYCARATITLAHPTARDDKPMIEIYMERPKDGQPGDVYAFRSLMTTKGGGPDYLRSRYDFQNEWNERFPPAADAVRCSND